MKYFADIISVSRIALSIPLIFFINNKFIFLIIYSTCGLSDILDGFIARKTNTQSTIGARLDSFADFIFYVIVSCVFIIWSKSHKFALILICLIVLVRLVNLLIAALKYHALVFIHTWANKATGFLVFLTPFVFAVWHNILFLIPVFAAAFLSAIEEGLIHLTSNKPDLNRKSIFFDK